MTRHTKVIYETREGWNPDAAASSLKAALDAPANRRVRGGLQTIKREKGRLAERLELAQKLGAGLAPSMQMLKRSWTLDRVDPGDHQAQAWVVRFRDNSPIARLQREGALDSNHVSAAQTFLVIYTHAVELPRMTASYEGGGGGARGPADFLNGVAESRAALEDLRSEMSGEEFKVVRDVAVYERSIAEVAKELKPSWQRSRGAGYIVARLTGGLERLIA